MSSQILKNHRKRNCVPSNLKQMRQFRLVYEIDEKVKLWYSGVVSYLVREHLS